MPDLRDDQAAALDALRAAVGEKKYRICMQAPTGWGKTVLTSALVESALAKSNKVLFIVPTISLVDQTVEMFASHGIWDVGVIQASHHMTNWNQPIQVASVQTLMKRTVPEADVVMIDEVHKWFTFYEKIVGTGNHRAPEWERVPVIGLSATPWRKGLGQWFDHFHRASTTQEMIDAGHLSPFKVFAPSHPDLSAVRIAGGDYHEGDLSEAMQKGRLVADAVDTWIRLGERRPTLCYAVDRAHAKALQMKFQAAGIPCGYQDAFTGDADKFTKTGDLIEGRKNIKSKFHSGEYPVVVNVETLTTGIDWDVRCIVICRPTKSDMLFTQIVGRGLRTAEGKDHCLILDHSDNHTRLGFVTSIDASYVGLHDGKSPKHHNRTDGIRLPKECPQCAFMKMPGTQQCPACGFVARVASKIKPEAGELRELKRAPPLPPVYPALRVETMEEKAAFFAELKYYAARQAYKPGWAAVTYKDKLGVWPNHPMIKHAPAAKWIRAETLGYIKSRLIAHARRRQGDIRHARV